MSSSVIFLFGAGASYPYGIPMMAGFYSSFKKYISDRYPNCYELLMRFESTWGKTQPDLEQLLSALESVLNIEKGLNLVGTVTEKHKEDVLTAKELRGYLDAFIVDTCEQFGRKNAIRELTDLLELRNLQQLWLFSTNYDRILEYVCEQNNIKYSDGFKNINYEPVHDWDGKFDLDVCVVKLHGSVNWYEDDPGGNLHRLERGYSLPAYNFRLVKEDQSLRPLMIIPTLEKEALGDPYIELSTLFTDKLRSSKVLIVIGNSLRDKHIRSYIKVRLNDMFVIIVSPNASKNRGIFNNIERTYCLDAGFSEFLIYGKEKLKKLIEFTINEMASDTEIAGKITEFIDYTTDVINDENIVLSNPNISDNWGKLQSDNVMTRIAAVTQLAKETHPIVVKRLKNVLKSDKDPHVRVKAVSALLAASNNNAIDDIKNVIINDNNQDVKVEAVLALAKHTKGEVREKYLKEIIETENIEPTVKAILQDILK